MKKKEKMRQKMKMKKKDVTRNICIHSFNSRGFDKIKQSVCLEISSLEQSKINIICNQENFVLEGNGYLIRQALPDYHIFIKPAKKDKLDGRPVNGMFLALPSYLRNKAKDVSPLNERMQGITLETDSGRLLLINVYFPSDPKTKNYLLDDEVEDLLATIENAIEVNHCESVVIIGDMNMDFARGNGRVARIEQFLSRNSIVAAWKRYPVDYTHELEMDHLSVNN